MTLLQLFWIVAPIGLACAGVFALLWWLDQRAQRRHEDDWARYCERLHRTWRPRW